MSDVCKWCGSLRMTKDFGGNPDQFWCGSTLNSQSKICEHRQEINTLTDALHATWDKQMLTDRGVLVIRVMEYEDFEKVRKAMDQ